MDIEFDQHVCEDISDNGQSLLEGLFLLQEKITGKRFWPGAPIPGVADTKGGK